MDITLTQNATRERDIVRGIKEKRIIVLAVSVVALTVFLFFPVMSYYNSRASLKVTYNLVTILYDLFSGNLTKGAYPPDGADMLYFSLPVGIAVWFAVMLVCVVTVIFVLAFVEIKSNRDLRLLGVPYIAVTLLLAAQFIVMITLDVKVESASKTVEFYSVFQIEKSFFLVVILLAAAGGVQIGLKPKNMGKVKRFWFIYLILAIPLVFMALFSYYPILLQSVMSFKDYKSSNGIWGSQWVGLRWFGEIFTSREMFKVILNSVYLSVLTLICNIVPSLILAIALYDMKRKKYQKAVQTIIYLPHFFSWVIIYAIYYAIMSDTGLVNSILKSVMNDSNYFRDFLTDPSIIRLVLMVTLIWKESGWGTILFTAALSNVDPSLYEAAEIDGAGPLTKLFRITLPSISSIIVFTIIMSIGSILNNSLDQILMFSNTVVLDKVYTIEMWVYKNGIGKQQFGLASAVGFVQSSIGLVLVLICNKLSSKVSGRGIW